MNNYLLEIGVEEFPSRFIPSTKEQLLNNVKKGLEESGVGYASYRLEATPRRFSLWLNDLQPLSQETEEIVKGPARKIAFDKDRNPSKALIGFAKGKNINLDDIFFEVKGKEEYVFAKIKKESVSIEKVLEEVVPKAIRQISNPRSMRWGGKNIHFLRPIRWIVSVYNDKALEFPFEGIPVSNFTRGHRFLSKKDKIEITSIDMYEEALKENFVIVDEKTRRDLIVRGLNRLARENGGVPLLDENLLQEVVYIVEYPTVFVGSVPEKYMSLPSEVIITPMKDHQRYFPILNDENILLPYFLSVRNGNADGIENVVKGNQKVLVPRLEDAKFFYDQDLKQPLESYNARLNELTFHEELGTMKDKTERLVSLVESLGEKMSCGEETTSNAKKAAELAKADLVTNMVVEFTELQGTMGRIYANQNGLNESISSAIEEQYMPRVSGGELPNTTAGMMLSIADKIDTIAGLFAIGIEVTGSQDPFGLRRAAIAINDILLQAKMHIDLGECFRDAMLLYVEQQGLVFDYDTVANKVREFFISRLRVRLREKGIRYDVLDAVLQTDSFDVVALREKAVAVQKELEKDTEYKLITSFIRIESMAKKAETSEIVEENLTIEDRSIYDSLSRITEIQEELVKAHYESVFQMFRDWMPLINEYLDNTMIMVDDLKVRENRLAILANIYGAISQILIPQAIVRD